MSQISGSLGYNLSTYMFSLRYSYKYLISNKWSSPTPANENSITLPVASLESQKPEDNS